ncbi:hypothetical protein DDZ14_17000 [Maritimibacter sp. 55A14]|uniref:hypothetical protein n=1 Tax=Maritimibacter sp. 55A14 TaxID=2174844 RepID=UPI000D61BA79|nr:hypothetical protein [Maritimibacter sp. 55A14]PWE29445.1 hypothetical protein DDZ14_17000 [Maritimibacter sp. 55A14]
MATARKAAAQQATAGSGGRRQDRHSMTVTRYHFLSGLPKAGVDVLLRVLDQNPAFVTGEGTAAAALFEATVGRMSDPSSVEAGLAVQQQKALLRAVLDAVHHDRPIGSVVFDSNPAWIGQIGILSALFPLSRFVVLLADAADLDGPGQREMRDLKAALDGPAAERILVIERGRLINDALTVMDVLYHFLREPEFDHDLSEFEAPGRTAGEGSGGVGGRGATRLRADGDATLLLKSG